jgi:hypothetical protein
MTQAQQHSLAGRRQSRVPRRVHFITDSDCGYTLEQIRTAPGSGILYAELHQRPTDEQRQRSLPAIAIMRTADELPAIGRSFSPEILSEAIRGTAILGTGRVEIVWEEPPSRLIDEAEAAARVERSPRPTRGEGPGWGDAIDDDLAGVPPQWVDDLATARQVLVEIDAAHAADV